VASVIIGATTLEQLETNLGSLDLRLSPELLSRIDEAHQRHGNPCP